MNSNIIKYLLGLLVFVSAFIFYYYLIFVYKVYTDIQPHAKTAYALFSNSGEKPSNFLYFLLVYVFSGFSDNYNQLLASSISIISIAIFLKYIITYDMFNNNNNIQKYTGKQQVYTGLIFVLILVISPIPWSNPFQESYFFFRGKISPTVWHNSTTIFLIPFALLLFNQSYLTIFKSGTNNLFLTIILVLINIAIKPSFFFVYAIVFPIFLLLKEKFSKRFFIYILPTVFGAIFLVIEYYIIYKLNDNNVMNNHRVTESSSITISPFELWMNTISPRLIPLSFFTSMLLPITYYLLYFKELFERRTLYVLSFFSVSVLLFILITETGPRKMHGNFAWQMIVCSYILFLNVISNIIIKYFNNEKKQERKKIFFLTFIFCLHLLSGIIWIFRIFYFKSYY